MCTRGQCVKGMGQWVSFRTPWGTHRGIVTGVNNQAVLMKLPRKYAPMGLATHQADSKSEEERLDVTLVRYGYGRYPGYGYAYGRRWGYPGYVGWYGGWYWWWLAFAWIFALAFLW